MAETIAQGTAEWMAEREGKVTSSRMAAVLSSAKDGAGISDAARTYAYEIIASELIGSSSFHNDATDWGANAEGLARHFYSLKSNLYVQEVGFIESDIEGYGGSPDGIIKGQTMSGTNIIGCGIVEFKCPFNTGNHIRHSLIRKDMDVPKNYYWQCQSNMYVAKAQWCDFVSFDPRINSDLGLFIYRLYRNEQDIKKMLDRVRTIQEFISEIKGQLGIKSLTNY